MFIIPAPQKMTEKEDKIKLSAFCVKADSSVIMKFADCFNENGDFCISFEKCKSDKREYYTLCCDTDGIKITYSDIEGAYRACSTLRQILAQSENGYINGVEIDDYPQIAHRGYMLDVSRGKIPTLKYLKSLADILADLKYNELQLYMESFVFEYKNFPEYTKDTEPLTREEIKELSQYCKERFIQLVPNQNSFGHMGSWTAKDELSHLAITGKNGKPSATLNPFKDESIELMDKIYDGFFDAFDSERVHIGMDEPFELGLNETKEECDRLGTGRVYTDYLNKICSLVSEKYNKTPMFWDDIVFKHHEQLVNIPKNTIVMQWGYETEQHFDRNCRRLQEQGLKFYVCPGTSMWGSFTGRTNNALVNITSAAECGVYYGADGFLLTEWGDGGHPQFPSMTYFPLVLGGSVSWNCMSHNHETAYAQRRELVDDCKKYTDKYLYCNKGEKSLADIAYRAGNYYLCEDALNFNGTELIHYIYKYADITDAKKEGFKRVAEYMGGILKELDEVKADETAVREIKCNCEIVLFLAKLLAHGKCEGRDRLFAEYEALWKMKNHTAGIHDFERFLEERIGDLLK